MKQKFTVTGMTCAACSARVEKVTQSVPGVERAEVNLMGGTMVVQCRSEEVISQIVQAVEKAGYGAAPTGRGKLPEKTQDDPLKEMKKRLIGSFVFLLVLMYFTMGHMAGLPLPHWYHGKENALVAALVQFLLTLPPVFLNRVYFSRGFKALWHRSPNMDSLIAVGSGASLIYGVAALLRMGYAMGHGDWTTVEFYSKNLYFESAAMILTLITLGKFLETRAKGKTGDAIRALMDLRPETVTVLRDGQEVTVPASEVRVGDTVLVRPGERIGVDGTVLEGRGSVDQSALTGESVPVEVEPGSVVRAASINLEGFLKLRADKIGEDTTLNQVIRLVEEAGGSKAPIARLADTIAGVFVPVVMGIAAVAFIVWLLLGESLEFALTTAISVLVISCPCALGLATPVAIMVGTGKGASLGVLFKNGAALEHLHRIDTVVLDKTGTLTTGKPAVTDLFPNDISEKELLTVAVALETPSQHPFAKAICQKAENLTLPSAEDFEILPGRGIAAVLESIRCFGGNRRLMEEQGISVPSYPELESQGKTLLYFADETKKYYGAIAVADVLKPDSKDAVAALKKQGLQVVMLTGDNQNTAAAIANQAGIDRVLADVLPTEKASAVKQLQTEGRKVLMVGDGINDAPALVTAEVGMAIGAGTDIAMESADVVLMGATLMGVSNAIRLSKATVRNIRQNLFWAFFYNCLGIPIAAGVLVPIGIHLSPMLGAAAMSLSSVFVVSNALRLRRFRPEKQEEKKEIIQEATDMKTVILVEGMMCPHCKAAVEKACKAVPGTQDAVVDLQAKNVTVTGTADVAALKKAITDAGYEVIG